jgi:hypothetical protein
MSAGMPGPLSVTLIVLFLDWSWVDGVPMNSGGHSYQQQLEAEAEANRQWRQQKYNAYVLSGGFLR